MVTVEELGLKPEKAMIIEETNYFNAISQLRDAGFKAVSPAQVMDLRIQNPDNNHPIWTNYFDTDTGITRTLDPSILLLPRCTALVNATSDTVLYGWDNSPLGTPVKTYGIKLPDNYDGNADNLDPQQLVSNRDLYEIQALDHKGWLALAGNDRVRLAEYVKKSFELGLRRWGYEEMMSFDVPTDNNYPIVNSIFLGGLDIRKGDCGIGDLRFNSTRLLGMREG